MDALFLSNYVLLSIMNAHKFAFQGSYILDVMPTVKIYRKITGKDNEYQKEKLN